MGPLWLAPPPATHRQSQDWAACTHTHSPKVSAHQQCQNDGSEVHQEGEEAYHDKGEDASYPPALPAGVHVDNGIGKTQVPVLRFSHLLKDEEPRRHVHNTDNVYYIYLITHIRTYTVHTYIVQCVHVLHLYMHAQSGGLKNPEKIHEFKPSSRWSYHKATGKLWQWSRRQSTV